MDRNIVKRALALSLMMGVGCAGAALPGYADTLRLHDGGELTGRVVSVSDEVVLFQTRDGARLPLNRDSVAELRFEGTAAASRPAAQQRSAYTGRSVDEELRAKYGEPQPVAISPPRVEETVFEEPAETVASADEPQPAFPVTVQPVAKTASMSNVEKFPSLSDLTMKVQPLFPLPPESKLKAATPMSRFTGGSSRQAYAGLYSFSNRGTFWAYLPAPATAGQELRFTLFGNLNKGKALENYRVSVKFMDEKGVQLEESAPVSYRPESDKLVEWFQYLDDVAGVAGSQQVSLPIPPGAKSMEFRVSGLDEGSNEPRLVGYVGQVGYAVPDRAATANRP